MTSFNPIVVAGYIIEPVYQKLKNRETNNKVILFPECLQIYIRIVKKKKISTSCLYSYNREHVLVIKGSKHAWY